MTNRLQTARKEFVQLHLAPRHLLHVSLCKPKDHRAMPIAALILSTLAFWLIYWFIRLGGIDHVHAKFAHRNPNA